jgi:hypothetical protein
MEAATHGSHGFAIQFVIQGQVFDDQDSHFNSPKG